jgi:hypothetical protein
MLLSPTFQSWREALPGVLLGILVATPAYIKLWRDRKKPVLEDKESEARTELAQASAQSLVIRDGIATGEGVGKMLASLIEAGETILEQSKLINEMERQAIVLERRTIHAEADAEAAQIYVEQLNMAAKLAGVHLSDYTPRQLNPPK